jgi:hypothetical protein
VGTARSSWRGVRTLRAAPYGESRHDDERRAVFLAALEQAEELAEAARAVAPPSKPLLLFYALSQAGRAIAADVLQAPGWRIMGHGASPKHSAGGKHAVDRVLDSTVGIDQKESGAFRVVSATLGSQVPGGAMKIADLWSSLPELGGPAWLAGLERRSLRLQSDSTGAGDALERLRAGLTQARVDLDGDQDLASTLDTYPSAAGYEIRTVAYRMGPKVQVVVWPQQDAPLGFRRLDEVGVSLGERGTYYLRPPVSIDGTTPVPLMTWWAILLALSSLARYEPEVWVAALDVNTSRIATALEALMEVAEARIPKLVEEALHLPLQRQMDAALRAGHEEVGGDGADATR